MKALLRQIKHNRVVQVALILVFFVFLLSRVEVYSLIVQRFPVWTGQRFWHAMRSNNLRLAKALSDQSQWEQVEDWISSHTVTSCVPFAFDDIGPTSGYLKEPNGAWYFSKSVVCDTPDGTLYCFSIYGVDIEKIGGDWTVTGWEDIDEGCE